jgi:ATP-dependent DNA ligase
MQGDTKAHFAHVQSVEKSLTPIALDVQSKAGWLGLYCWDIPFMNGEDLVTHRTVIDRYSLIMGLCASIPHSLSWIQPVSYCRFESTDKATEWAKKNELEGWVVVDPQGVYGDKGWNMKGDPDRPREFCAKLKPWFEDDFIVQWDPSKKWGTHGKGKHEKDKIVELPSGEKVKHGGIGSVGLFQYNSRNELVYICDCSSGMDYEFQAKLNAGSFPFVAEIKYVDRSYISDGDDTNALTFPGFVRVRTDKSPDECINERL